VWCAVLCDGLQVRRVCAVMRCVKMYNGLQVLRVCVCGGMWCSLVRCNVQRTPCT
jgi:hypothetical protein